MWITPPLLALPFDAQNSARHANLLIGPGNMTKVTLGAYHSSGGNALLNAARYRRSVKE
jgi:hypothetical protein